MKMSIKQVLRFAKDEFIYGSHLLSLGAVGIVMSVAIIMDVAISWDFLVLAYLIFHVIYLYNRYKEFDKDFLTNSERTNHVKRFIKYYPIVILCSVVVIMFILIRRNDTNSFIFGLVMLLMGFAYTDYFKNYTKNIIGFKSIYVAFVWALLVIYFGIYHNLTINSGMIILFFYILARWLLNTIYFDYKDVDSDKKENLKTFPVVLEKNKFMHLLSIINTASLAPIMIGVFERKIPIFTLSLLFFYFYGLLYLKSIKKNNINIQKFSYIVVDGEFIVLFIVVYITKIIIF